MINRHYFVSANKYHDDGSGSFSFITFTMTVRSFFVNGKAISDGAYDHVKESLRHKKGLNEMVHITSINRL